MTDGVTGIAVCVATYRRLGDLRALLASLDGARRHVEFRVIVADNDPDNSAASLLAEAAQELPALGLVAVHEPTPGIAAARNATLSLLGSDDAWIVFVDDDEVVPEHWMAELVAGQQLYGADIVCGPVRSVFPPETPAWILRGGFIQRPALAAGSPPDWFLPATNNTLVRRSLIDALEEPRFDDTFSATGGSDSELFSRIARQRPVVAWHPPAEVSEDVPASRLTAKWIVRRRIRLANVAGRLLLRSRPTWYVAGFGMAKIVQGVLSIARSVVTGKGLRDHDLARATYGIGLLGACSGRLVQEYARPSKS